MLNKDLFDDKKDAEIARLKMTIEKFKEYDQKRKQYYNEKMERLGELESLVQEMEDGEDMGAKLIRYKNRLSYLEQLIRAKNIQEDMSLEESKEIIKFNEYKSKNEELRSRIKSMSDTISNLAIENVSLKNKINNK